MKRFLCLYSLLAVFSSIAIISVSAQYSTQTEPVTDICLGCICEAMTGCNLQANCTGDVCGLFGMTFGYWIDGGRLAADSGYQADPSQGDLQYRGCARDPLCSANTIQNYMKRYGKDCNGDGYINCYDYGAIHKMGPLACHNALPQKYVQELDQCLQHHQYGN